MVARYNTLSKNPWRVLTLLSAELEGFQTKYQQTMLCCSVGLSRHASFSLPKVSRERSKFTLEISMMLAGPG